MTNEPPASGKISFLTKKPVRTAAAIPIRYNPNTRFCPFFGKKATAKSTYTGNRAPQLIKGAISTVKIRSVTRSIVRVAITAGTLQPKPTISGTKARPGRPRKRIRRSITKAARAMYPESSKIAKKKNRKNTTGIKVETV